MLVQQFRHSGHNKRQCHSLHTPILNAVDFFDLFGADMKKLVVSFSSLTQSQKLTGLLFETMSFSQSRIKWKDLANKLCTFRPGTCN